LRFSSLNGCGSTPRIVEIKLPAHGCLRSSRKQEAVQRISNPKAETTSSLSSNPVVPRVGLPRTQTSNEPHAQRRKSPIAVAAMRVQNLKLTAEQTVSRTSCTAPREPI